MSASPLLVRWYGLLVVVAGMLATKAIVMPRWPATPASPPQGQLEESLQAQGLTPASDPHPPASSGSSPARRSYELSTSPLVTITLRDGYELVLMAGSVRQRFNLQSSFIGRDQPSLQLSQRSLIRTPTPSAAGLLQGHPALQTCLVSGPGMGAAFGVTREELTPLADRLATGWGAGLERLLGLKPNRAYDCTLISLRGPLGKPPSEQFWEQILGTVASVLRPPA
jgi:hypothetical protein